MELDRGCAGRKAVLRFGMGGNAMSALREASIGPIVGHTSAKTSRIWIRGSDADDKGAMLHSRRRTVGIIAITHVDGKPIRERDRKVFYFRLHRKYDRTGAYTLGSDVCLKEGKASPPLQPATSYTVRVGTLTLDDPFDDDRNIGDDRVAEKLPDALVWWEDLVGLEEKPSTATFRTYAAESAKPGKMSLILGSCRYPGFLWKVKEADEIFRPLRKEAEGEGKSGNNRQADFVFMVGDQIYADMMNRHVPIGLADTFEEFQERYHTAFGSRNTRRLLRSIPTYMILDDHEIEDNWTQDRIEKKNPESRKLFNLAISSYMSYQWLHGPRNFNQRLYYAFECNGYPFFVLDSRTQRFVDDLPGTLADNHLLGRPTIANEEPSQLARLLRWLIKQQNDRGNAPKFIGSSSVFAPSPMSAREGRGDEDTPENVKVKWKEDSDSWPAFPNTRRAILRCIIENNIQNVIFLSGDIHCSNVARIRFSGSADAEKLVTYSITSSAFYWPFFFADGDPSNFVHDSSDPDQLDTFDIDGTHKMDYRAWNFTQEDNFCRIDVDPQSKEVVVKAMDKTGGVIRKKNWLGKPTGPEMVSTLKLANW